MSYHVARLMSRLICLLPWTICLWIADALAAIAWLFVPRRRKELSRENIMRCFGLDARSAEKISRAAAVQYGQVLIEVLRFPALRSSMKSHVEIEGLKYLTDYIQSDARRGRGAVIATCHSDNWELMGGAFAQFGISLVGVAKKQKSGGLDRFINEYRTLIGMHITYKTGVREMFQMLSDGWFIGLIMDQDTNRHDGVVVKFFGEPTNFMPGAASMARFKDIPIFPAFMHRMEDRRHKLIVYPPIFVEKTRDKRADLQRTTQRLATLIERHVREYPEQWFWLHDRWKSMREEFSPDELAQLRKIL